MVDIKGLDKASVLQALHGASKAQGMGFLHDRGGLSLEECRAEIEETAKGPFNRGRLYFDYLRGRVMKVDLTGETPLIRACTTATMVPERRNGLSLACVHLSLRSLPRNERARTVSR